MQRLGLLVLILSFWTSFIYAQKRQFYVNAPSTAMAGETFQISYTIQNPKNSNPRFVPPKPPNGIKFYGTSSYSSNQSSISIVNGRLKAVSNTRITWIITATATKKGQYTIPPALVYDGNEVLKSNPVTISIEGVSNNNLPKPNPRIANAENQVENLPNTNKQLFLDLVASRKSVYLGQAIYVYARIYSRYHLSIDDMKPASFPGFWVQELPMPSNIQAEDVIINGRRYLAATLDKRVIFPQRTGTLKINPYQLTVTLYDNFGFPYTQKDVISNPLFIKVKPLPTENKPNDFSGAVGQFKFKIIVNKNEVNVDEPLTIKVVVSGTGNFGLFDIPKPLVPNSFEELEPKQIPQYQATAEGLQGRIIKQYIYIPRATGDFHLGQIRFSYFDPQTNQYKIISSNAFDIKVIGTKDTTQQYSSYSSAVKQLGSDINYIYLKKIKLHKRHKFFAGSTLHYLSYLIALIIFLIVVYVERKTLKLRADERSFKARRANKVSQKRLKLARKYMKAGEKEKFYEEVANALWGYLGDKLAIAHAELTRDKVREELASRNVPQQVIDELIQTIDYCEFARYSPGMDNFSMADIYQKATSLIDKLEKIS